MGWYVKPKGARLREQSRKDQLKANQLDRIVMQVVKVPPDVYLAAPDRLERSRARFTLAQSDNSHECTQDPIVEVGDCAAPAPVHPLVIEQPIEQIGPTRP
jgi:hypothetical protein